MSQNQDLKNRLNRLENEVFPPEREKSGEKKSVDKEALKAEKAAEKHLARNAKQTSE